MTSPPIRFVPSQPGYVELQGGGPDAKFRHQFETRHIDAINTAIACKRPLLVSGEPGVGKTQLARAAAKALERAFVRFTVDAKTESRDLLWHFDAVARLAQAQVAPGMGWKQAELEQRLQVRNYLRPGPLWWGFDWETARTLPISVEPPQPDGGDYRKGVVVLIDEIDKAEIDVPNGLLEALGDGSFQPEGMAGRVSVAGVAPLIVITTNLERSLPRAFVRRCVVLDMKLPEDDEALHTLLVARGGAHCEALSEDVLKEAATQLVADRNQARRDKHRLLPGQAEYLDLLRAVAELSSEAATPEELVELVKPYILAKGDVSL